MAKDDVEKVTGVFAFWRYDRYPYVLGAEIEAIDGHGNVRPVDYGGHWFRAFKLLSVQAGKKLQARLQKLRTDKAAADALSDQTWNTQLFELMPEARDPESTYAGFPRKVDDKQ